MYGPKVRFLIECSKGLLRMDRKLLFKSAQKHVHIHIYFVKIPEKTEVNKSHQENLEAYFIKWTTSGEPPVDFINHCHFNFRSNKGRVKKGGCPKKKTTKIRTYGKNLYPTYLTSKFGQQKFGQ